MKERSILFSRHMVHALLDGRKTQTRRIVKRIPKTDREMVYCDDPAKFRVGDFGWVAQLAGNAKESAELRKDQHLLIPRHHVEEPTPWENCGCERVHCPHGEPGDRLWVKETFAPNSVGKVMAQMLKAKEQPAIYYRATHEGLVAWRWRPSIFMPRWASRITLEVTGIRVERLQEITEEDAIAEGIESDAAEWKNYFPGPTEPFPWFKCPIHSYCSLWESINGAGSWSANPFVWVIEFKRIESGVAHG